MKLTAGALVWLAVLARSRSGRSSAASRRWRTFFVRRVWAAGALLALAAVPGLVLVVPLLVLEARKVEDGAVVGVPAAASWQPAPAGLARHGAAGSPG